MIIEKIDTLIRSNNKLGVFVSGGLDSTLLAYLLYRSRKLQILKTQFVFFTVPRYDNSLVHAQRVVALIARHFDAVYPTHLIVGDPDAHHSVQVLSGVVTAQTRHASMYDSLVLAANKTPEELPGGPARPPAKASNVHLPFRDYTKDSLIELYSKLLYETPSLLDIMAATHTCTEQVSGACGVCWQCRERAWAFDKNNMKDPGCV